MSGVACRKLTVDASVAGKHSLIVTASAMLVRLAEAGIYLP
jgi:hypothetical protein